MNRELYHFGKLLLEYDPPNPPLLKGDIGR